MLGFSGLSVVSIGGVGGALPALIYTAVSRINNGGAFYTGQGAGVLDDVYIWDDGEVMTWDDDIPISIYG